MRPKRRGKFQTHAHAQPTSIQPAMNFDVNDYLAVLV